MLRTHTCGGLTIKNLGEKVTLSGWLQRSRDLGGMTFIDLRDRYGITQLVFNMENNAQLCGEARKLGREYVLSIIGTVAERSNKNLKMATGEIEIIVEQLNILNAAKTPPFTIEENTDGGDDLRMKYRYLDLRRQCIRENLELRHKVGVETRNYLNQLSFIEVETPFLIKSTPEGARDFVVPSRMNPGEFYALPQSPQTFKQLLMVSGFDRYFQIVRCFRDEDLRADRQPEFTQIDCEMSFVTQEDILQTFEGMAKHLFKSIKGLEIGDFPRMTYADAMKYYGCDKPDIRFGMQFVELINEFKELASWMNINAHSGSTDPLRRAEYIGGICVTNCANYTRKQLDELTEFVKRPQIGGQGLIYLRWTIEEGIKSPISKYYEDGELESIATHMGAKPGDLILIICGETEKAQKALCELRLEMGHRLGLRKADIFAPLWVIDFPLLEWDKDTNRFYAKHHPFTSPKPEDIDILDKQAGNVRANAYDLVINGVEVGGGSIRIHDKTIQKQMFQLLGFSEKEAQNQFGYLMDAFEYGAPPHGGIAFGFDRFCAIFGGADSIRDFIAFPKNNSGRDIMSGSPSTIAQQQLDELQIKISTK